MTRSRGALSTAVVATFALEGLAVTACSRDWSFLAPGIVADAAAGQDAADAVDGSADADAGAQTSDGPLLGCDVDAAFRAPRLVGGVNSIDDELGASLMPDELTIYFASGVQHVWFDIYVATRVEAGADFGSPVKLADVSTPSFDMGANVTGDGLTLFVDSYYVPDSDAASQQVQRSTRGALDAGFGTPVVLQELVYPSQESANPYALGNGKVLYLASSRTGHFDIYRAPSYGDSFQAPVLVDGVSDPDFYDAFPVVTADELTMYFASARLKGGYETDIFVAHRSSDVDGFGTPVLVPELASAAPHSYPSWLSADACRLYFASDRSSDAGTSGSLDLWVAERGP